MIFVLNKEKILCYAIAFSMVAIIIGVGSMETFEKNAVETTTAKNVIQFNENNIID